MSMTQENKKQPLIFAIGSGKGGVGKSTISANLAVYYAKANLRVAILDLDFGACNLHTIFGVHKATQGWGHYFFTKEKELEEYLIPTPQKNLSLLPGDGFTPDLANISYEEKLRLINDIKRLEYDVIFLDLGAGTSANMVDFLSISDVKILISTLEPTSIANNFEFLQNLVYRSLKRIFKDEENIQNLLESFKKGEIESLKSLSEKVGEINEWAQERLLEFLKGLDVFVIFNQLRRSVDHNLGMQLKNTCKQHLMLDIQYPGVIFYNEEVPKSVSKMIPISMDDPSSITAKIIKRLAYLLMQQYKSRFDLNQKDLFQVIEHAQKDYEINLLTQRKIARDALSKS